MPTDMAEHRIGIIPAYAGNTCYRRQTAPRRRDHPRVCGEHRRLLKGFYGHAGSSPRMRGTQDHGRGGEYGGGIIPAYAGNTDIARTPLLDRGDHPRVCGEHVMAQNAPFENPGSSPRMRGTRRTAIPFRRFSGIIPAYAGNTSMGLLSLSKLRDHPRVCGEHTLLNPSLTQGEGSSPRMRGTQEWLALDYDIHGIIPAYARNTKNNLPAWVRLRDHPRVCGEHVKVP